MPHDVLKNERCLKRAFELLRFSSSHAGGPRTRARTQKVFIVPRFWMSL